MNYFISFLILLFSFCFADLNRPTSGELLNYIHVVFDWDQEPMAHSYQLELSPSITFNDNSFIINEVKTTYVEQNNIDWSQKYFWRVRPIYYDNSYGPWLGPDSFMTAQAELGPFNPTLSQPSLVQNGLTVFGNDWPFSTIVFDLQGREVWNDGDNDFLQNYISPYGELYGFGVQDWPSYTGTEFNFRNEILWHGPDDVYIDGHDFQQIPNGNYMGFVHETQMGPIPEGDWTFIYQGIGYVADGETIEFPWVGNKLVEWDQETGQEVWSWNAFDYYSMLDYDAHGGTWWWGTEWHDWMHSNAFHFDEEESAIYMSHRHLSRITKIDYPSGDILWMMGLPCPYMGSCATHICTELKFSFQHNIQLTENGNLLFFDNGNISPILHGFEEPLSRVLEVEVSNSGDCEVIWEYTLDEDLYGPMHGSVQQLTNGNYLINTFGGGGTILEISPDKELVWSVHLGPISDPVYSYRAYRIPSIHPDAFSIIVNNYRNIELVPNFFVDGIILDDENTDLSFNIHNATGYTQPYVYTISDEIGFFNQVTDTLLIEAYGSSTVNILPDIHQDSVSSLSLEIWPRYHDYAIKSLHFDIFKVSGVLSSLEPKIPKQYKLYNSHPNPFNAQSTIHYNLPNDVMVNIIIYDVLGRLVKKMVNDFQKSGYKSIVWDGTDDKGAPVSAGVYFYSMQAGGFIKTKKMILLK
tara:strand:+ start:1096 stop:3174 length:2079 start_codon:yes stop_codon:yes gene_type:complete